jgi:hypothetical protein
VSVLEFTPAWRAFCSVDRDSVHRWSACYLSHESPAREIRPQSWWRDISKTRIPTIPFVAQAASRLPTVLAAQRARQRREQSEGVACSGTPYMAIVFRAFSMAIRGRPNAGAAPGATVRGSQGSRLCLPYKPAPPCTVISAAGTTTSPKTVLFKHRRDLTVL